MALRSLPRHRITLAPTDTIVLAEVENRTGDPVFDNALNDALRYEMEQTPYLNLPGLDKTYSTSGPNETSADHQDYFGDRTPDLR